MTPKRRWIAVAAAAACSLATACGGDDDEVCAPLDTSYQPMLDPARFVDGVDNPLFPLVPGSTSSYREGANGTVEITVTAERRTILGISAVVVHDVASLDGEVVEDTLDWYAQDVDGAVWYLGEDTKEYRNGRVVSTEGSWEAGVDGAQPGVLIPASPTVGLRYRQEYYRCEAEDYGEILALDETVTVAAGTFEHCLQTHDYTPLEPDVNEQKWYCPGVGTVLSLDVETGEREELVSSTSPG